MALVTADDIKTARGISGAALDTVLAGVASAASQMVIRYLGRSVIEQAAVSNEVVVSIGTPILQLAEWPIASSPAPTCTEDGVALTFGTNFDCPEPYGSVGLVRRIDGSAPTAVINWSTDPSGIVFGYTAGYAAASAPLIAIQTAALYQALLIWSHHPRSGDNRNQSAGKTYPQGGSVTYRGEAWNEVSIGLLEPYRRRF